MMIIIGPLGGSAKILTIRLRTVFRIIPKQREVGPIYCMHAALFANQATPNHAQKYTADESLASEVAIYIARMFGLGLQIFTRRFIY